jgi:poly(3-hydroxybutyrate) depolymerase
MSSLTRREMLAYVSVVSVVAVNAVSICPAVAANQLEDVSVTTSSGHSVSGLMAVPATVPAPAVLLIHGGSGVTR